MKMEAMVSLASWPMLSTENELDSDGGEPTWLACPGKRLMMASRDPSWTMVSTPPASQMVPTKISRLSKV